MRDEVTKPTLPGGQGYIGPDEKNQEPKRGRPEGWLGEWSGGGRKLPSQRVCPTFRPAGSESLVSEKKSFVLIAGQKWCDGRSRGRRKGVMIIIYICVYCYHSVLWPSFPFFFQH